jgi:DNA-directed RNA polymerase subunit F
MLNETKKDLTMHARKLLKPYEQYSIDELADAYCDAIDNNDGALKDIYVSALILRFWYTIDKMYKANTVAPSLEHEDFFWWLYEAIEYACKYRGWRDPNKKLNAQQCINKCIETIKLQKYYDLRLDKRKVVNHCCSIDTPLGGEGDEAGKTIGDMLESEVVLDDYCADDDAVYLVQSYINRNKIIEAILLDNIAFNDVQKHYKKTIKKQTEDGETIRYVEHSSEFWPYRLIQIVSKLPDTYKSYFMERYTISEEKLTAILDVIDRANNQKLYRYLDKTLAELRVSYAS